MLSVRSLQFNEVCVVPRLTAYQQQKITLFPSVIRQPSTRSPVTSLRASFLPRYPRPFSSNLGFERLSENSMQCAECVKGLQLIVVNLEELLELVRIDP